MHLPQRTLFAVLAGLFALLLTAVPAHAFPPPDAGVAAQCTSSADLLPDPVGADGFYRCSGPSKATYERCPGDLVFSVGAGACVSRAEFPPELGDWAVSVSAPRGTTVRLGGGLTFRVSASNLDGVGELGAVRVRVSWPRGLSWGGSPDCVRVGDRSAYCYLGVEHGATASVGLVASPGLLTIGALRVRGEVLGSSPVDTNAANNTSTATCRALTGLIVTC